MAEIIDQPEAAGAALKNGQVVVAYFGRVLGFFALSSGGDQIAEIKGHRVGEDGTRKPMTFVSAPKMATTRLNKLPSLSPQYSTTTLKKLQKVLMLNSKGSNPIGFLLDAKGKGGKSWTIGSKVIGNKMRTLVGLMVSTYSKHDEPYNIMVEHTGEDFILGTSANLGGDPFSRDSAHSRIGPLMEDFGGREIQILRPPTARILDRVSSASTTQVYFPSDQPRVAYLVREGSIRRNLLGEILQNLDIKLNIPDEVVIAETYNYGGRYGLGSSAKVFWSDLRFLLQYARINGR